MLTDAKLRSLKPAERAYKVADRDGLHVVVSPSGSISFRYNYRINGRQETLVIGSYGPDGLTLAAAREKLLAARKQVAEGISPARLKPTPSAIGKSSYGFLNGPRNGLKNTGWPSRPRRHADLSLKGICANPLGRCCSMKSRNRHCGSCAIVLSLVAHRRSQCMPAKSSCWYSGMLLSVVNGIRIPPTGCHRHRSPGSNHVTAP